MTHSPRVALIDGSRLIIEALVQSGADTFIGYPITPSNLLFQYASERFPRMLGAPDEITTLQWMSGAAATGLLTVTATSFPGFALMVESINMAFMMELPMVIILAQRLGPATGTATTGAQGDLALVRGMISGGFPVPTLCISSLPDCWDLSHEALRVAVSLRTPVILLTSKEMIMTMQDFDLATLKPLSPIKIPLYKGEGPYLPYAPDERGVPPFLPLGNPHHQVRMTASTHDATGLIQAGTPEALGNSTRLHRKIVRNLPDYTWLELDEQPDARRLVVAYDVTAGAAREAVRRLREQGHRVSLLVVKTLFPTPPQIFEVIDRYERVVFPEENLTGQFVEHLFGQRIPSRIRSVHSFGAMIPPAAIMQEVIA
ncbi:MAG: 2-oxoglutarate oxidoreductase, alpha subunit [Candidatus Ozemobacter sibiricus]|jgi:2-oxoglutarate ferredoxin oxidoreductase subunit alpha|uniref:2-oxoglutarate oxidoreductase, alpha subunit n=1 Tax=Candidatus Ozemobacter sibiricus TaxID=2268124 RepID=A0A367ZU35_9BACT|nr:MAG: 2-oxoglutarate oxidoreductase, alpha subunit [Candidatus Ozemobacter sibiricus]